MLKFVVSLSVSSIEKIIDKRFALVSPSCSHTHDTDTATFPYCPTCGVKRFCITAYPAFVDTKIGTFALTPETHMYTMPVEDKHSPLKIVISASTLNRYISELETFGVGVEEVNFCVGFTSAATHKPIWESRDAFKMRALNSIK